MKMRTSDLEIVKLIGKYLKVSVGSLCYNTSMKVTAVLDNENVEGFMTIILLLTSKSGVQMTQIQWLLSYQWLEYIVVNAKQAAVNPTLAKSFLKAFDDSLQKDTYLTGQFMTIADVAAYYTLYPFLESLSTSERESLLNLCRWSRHVQVQPKVCENMPPLPLDTIILSLAVSVDPLPKQLYPHELKNKNLEEPVVYHPQPFSFPGYPVVVYL